MNFAALSLIALAIAAARFPCAAARPASYFLHFFLLAWGMSMAVVAAIGRYIVFGLLWG